MARDGKASSGGRGGESTITTVEELEDKFLECRDLRHAWKYIGWTPSPSGGVYRNLRCVRCKTERSDRLRWDGKLYTRSYYYPDNYLIHGLTDRGAGVRVADVRIELLHRQFPDGPPKEFE